MPIWTLNELHHGRTGAMMWAATEFEFKNRHVSFHKRLSKDTRFRDRVDTAIDWMRRGSNFVMMYIEQPDSQAHRYGHKSAKVICSSFFHTLTFLLDTETMFLWTSFIGTRSNSKRR